MSAADDLRKQVAAEDAAVARSNLSPLHREKEFIERARQVEFAEPELREVLHEYFTQAQRIIGGRVELHPKHFKLKSKGYELRAQRVFVEELAYQVDAGPWNALAAWTLEVKTTKGMKRNGLIWLLLGPHIERPEWYELGADFGAAPLSFASAMAKLSQGDVMARGEKALDEVRKDEHGETVERWMRYLVHTISR